MLENFQHTPANTTGQDHYQLTAIAYDKRGKVISMGSNSYLKTHPIQAHFAKKQGTPYKQYLHAEIDALIKADRPVHRLMVFRIGANGKYLSAKPCAICMSAMKAYGVKIIEST